MSSRRFVIAGGISIWIGLAVVGMNLLMANTYSPGPAAELRPAWPASLSLRPAAGRPTLLLCLHPRCPCSEATLDSLQTLLDQARYKPAVYALLSMPDNADAKWTDNDMADRLKSMAGVEVIYDKGGRLSQAFDARTSGQAFAYTADAKLAFQGGLTPGRGESGPCEATAFLKDFLADPAKPADLFQSHVFGCALYRSAEVVR